MRNKIKIGAAVLAAMVITAVCMAQTRPFHHAHFRQFPPTVNGVEIGPLTISPLFTDPNGGPTRDVSAANLVVTTTNQVTVTVTNGVSVITFQ